MTVATYTVLGFILGSIPFAFYLAKFGLQVDVREYGPDGNPGAVNAWRAGGWRFGVLGGVLDFAKGFIPVFMAQYVSGLSGWALFPIAVAPILGHAFSPLLSFRGGKAVAASFGVWAGLTQGWGFLVYAVTCGLFWRLQTADAWATVMGQLGLLVFCCSSLRSRTCWRCGWCRGLWSSGSTASSSDRCRTGDLSTSARAVAAEVPISRRAAGCRPVRQAGLPPA